MKIFHNISYMMAVTDGEEEYQFADPVPDSMKCVRLSTIISLISQHPTTKVDLSSLTTVDIPWLVIFIY